MGQQPISVARGIIRVANEHMARALRTISVQRGIDPRGFVLVSFGGAGGLHVCALAEALELREAIVPVHAGVLSALGMLVARPGRQLSRSWLGRLDAQDPRVLEAGFRELFEQGRTALAAEGVAAEVCQAAPSVDLRYPGQSYTLNLAWQGVEATARAFHLRHEERYGHRMTLPIELVNLRQAITGPAPAIALGVAPARTGSCRPVDRGEVVGHSSSVPIYRRVDLPAAAELTGPAILVEPAATTWLAAGWRARVDGVGNLHLSRARVGATVTGQGSRPAPQKDSSVAIR
jgi:N-methylhydantoinase A